MSATRAPRIGVDCHAVNGIQQGIRTHILELFGRAVTLAPELQFVLLAPDPKELVRYSSGFLSPNVELVRMPETGPTRRLLWELPALQRKCRLDLLHCQYIVPPRLGCPSVVTIHDVLFETHPEYFSLGFRLRSSLLMRFSARAAAAVCTVSEFSRREVAQRFGASPERTFVTPNAANTSRFVAAPGGEEVVRARGLEPGRYYLSVGRLEPRKNHANLVRAHLRLPPGSPPLVIVGQPHFGFAEVQQLLGGNEDRIHVLSDVSDEDLPAFYRNALSLVYPSWAEGFGMPIVEAFASGTPVICGANTGLAEVAGNAALIIDPADVAGIADAMHRIASDQVLRGELVRLGMKQAKLYTWDNSAATLVDVYRNLFPSSSWRQSPRREGHRPGRPGGAA